MAWGDPAPSPGNQSDHVRIGLNVAYYPPWFNNWIEGGHQPLWPETYERMPEDFRRLCPGLLVAAGLTAMNSGDSPRLVLPEGKVRGVT